MLLPYGPGLLDLIYLRSYTVLLSLQRSHPTGLGSLRATGSISAQPYTFITTTGIASRSLTYEFLSFRRRFDTVGLLAVCSRGDAVVTGDASKSTTAAAGAIAATTAATTSANTGDTSITWIVTKQRRLSRRSAMRIETDKNSNRSSNGDGQQARVDQPSESCGHGESRAKKRRRKDGNEGRKKEGLDMRSRPQNSECVDMGGGGGLTDIY